MASETEHPLHGAALTVGAALVFALLDAVTKDLTTRVALMVVIWGRYAVNCLFTVGVFWPQVGARLLHTRHPLLQSVRGLALVTTTGLVVAALRHLPLAETTALVFSAPLLSTPLAVPLLGERMTLRRTAATGVGFIGVLLIARPGGSLSGIGVTLALGGAACLSVYHVLTRKLSGADPPMTQLFYMALVGSVAAFPALLWTGGFGGIAPGDWMRIVLVGVLAGVGHYLMIRAYKAAGVNTIAPYIYTQLVWAMLLGWLAYRHLPDAYGLAGIAVIMASGLFVTFARR
jgi:drug/metabolite transporter (DMT)-like permease